MEGSPWLCGGLGAVDDLKQYGTVVLLGAARAPPVVGMGVDEWE